MVAIYSADVGNVLQDAVKILVSASTFSEPKLKRYVCTRGYATNCES